MIIYGVLANFGDTELHRAVRWRDDPDRIVAQVDRRPFPGIAWQSRVCGAVSHLLDVLRGISLDGEPQNIDIRRVRNWGYGILIAAFLLFFWASQTRGAFFGLGAGIFVFFLYRLFQNIVTLRKYRR